MGEAFALQKLLAFFQQKILLIWEINFWNFNETLTNDIVSFEQPGPGKKPGTKHYNRGTVQKPSHLKMLTYWWEVT